MADVKNPGLAAVLSAVIPGIGQFYNGDCRVIAAVTAPRRARKKNLAIA